MPRASQGTYTLPSSPFIIGTVIDPAPMNANFDDIKNALSDSLSRSGTGGMLAPMRVPDGSSALPSYSFTGDIGVGLYRAGTYDIRFVAQGSDLQTWTLTGVSMSRPLTVNPAITNVAAFIGTGNGTGNGATLIGGTPVGGNVNGGHGVVATGGAASGTGTGGSGGVFTGTGAGAGVTATGGSTNGGGGVFTGGGTAAGVTGTGGGTSGYGVRGVGGGPNGTGLRGEGVGTGYGLDVVGSNAGGQGANIVGGTPTAANSNGGIGAIIIGGVPTGTGTSGLGLVTAPGVAASATTPTYAQQLNNGYLRFASSTVPPNPNVALMNTLAPSNIPKAWAKVTTNGAGGVTVLDGVNLTAAINGTTVRFTFPTGGGMANANYGIVITAYTIGGATISTATHYYVFGQTLATFDILAYRYDFSTTITLTDVTLNNNIRTFSVHVVGNQ